MPTANEIRVGLERYGPVEIRHELQSSSALLDAINEQVKGAKAEPLFKAKWSDLYVDWLEFYRGKLGPTGVLSNLRDSTFDRAAAFRREALKFRYALIQAAATPKGTGATGDGKGSGGIHLPSLPDVYLPSLPNFNLPSFPWRVLVYGGVAVVGGIVLVKVIGGQRR